ncbi:hypothetical protein FCM35_KLT22053 [Carex littledalei]|uniref:Uncharacterized protein n=1 Tax=Carex littledalei TaxID=544730 RepID=A0A833QC25_9POAL|nr:hypothetical protein FCM35_KLT22053 [Carex littledalei]
MLLVGGQTRPRVGTELGATRAVAHHSPLPATHDGRTLGPTAPRGSEGQCPHLFALRQPSVDGLLTPVRQACPREGPSGATCVQRLDGSRDSAIHTTYRISLRSSSMREPRYPLPRVILFFRRPRQPAPPRSGSPAPQLVLVFLGVIPRRIPASDRRARRARGKRPAGAEEAASASRAAICHACNGRVFREATAMILPQVHLRKPCYDFSFL